MNAVDYWEGRYAGTEPIWSGRVNAVLADVAANLTPGRALDLGCGEGGDVLWLAARGWQATGIDISPTAIDRAESRARSEGLDAARFLVGDLSVLPDGPFDLVTASFLQSPVELARTDILRRASALVARGGHLLVTSHAAAPPWSDHHEHRFPTPDEEVSALALGPAGWRVLLAETRSRQAVGPSGETGTLEDSVVLMEAL